MLFLRVDQSQADSRVVYVLSHNEELIKLARSQPHEFDVHKFVGSCIFQQPESEIKGDKRQATKKIAHGCLTGDHEVLTLGGWRPIEQVSYAPIAVWAPDGRVWFEYCARSAHEFTGNLLAYEAQAFSQIITPYHRMPYLQTHSSEILVKPAEEIARMGKGTPLPVSSLYSGGLYGDEWFGRFLAAVQADGSFRGLSGTVKFHFHKERKYKRIQELAEALKYKYKAKDNNGDYTVTVYRTPALVWLPNKQFSHRLFELSAVALDGLLDELKYWDGNLQKSHHHRREMFTSSIKANCEWVQTLAHLRGKGSRVAVKPHLSGFGTQMYTASLNRRQYAHRPDPVTVPYNGLVYCFKTSTSFFLVRHNGKISVTGNTHYDEQEQRMSDSLLKDGYFFTPEECKVGQMRYLNRFPAIRDGFQFKSRMLVVTGNRRYLENSWGRRIYFTYERFDPNLYRRIYAWRAASEVADTLNQWGFIPAVQFLDKYNFKSRVNLQVHDEVLSSVTPENDECWDLMRVLRDSMEREREYEGVKLTIPVTMSLETRYHSEEVEWKKFPSYEEYKETIMKLWEQRIQ